ncbi:MAG: hypothetical protein V1701_00215 [Planctomycetota bacterium]
MDVFENIRLTRLPKPTRLLVTMFLLMMALGSLLAAVNTWAGVGMNYTAIVNYILGFESYPKSYPGMDFKCLITLSHTHVIAMGLMVFCLGLVFQFTGTLPLWLKKFILAFSFISVLLVDGSFWVVKYATPMGAYLMMLSGMLFGICVFLETATPLYEMWIKKETRAD